MCSNNWKIENLYGTASILKLHVMTVDSTNRILISSDRTAVKSALSITVFLRTIRP